MLTRTTNNTDGDGLAKKGLMYDLLYSSTTAKMEPTFRNGERTILFCENIALVESRTEGKRVLQGLVVWIRKIEIIYWVQYGLVGSRMTAKVV